MLKLYVYTDSDGLHNLLSWSPFLVPAPCSRSCLFFLYVFKLDSSGISFSQLHCMHSRTMGDDMKE